MSDSHNTAECEREEEINVLAADEPQAANQDDDESDSSFDEDTSADDVEIVIEIRDTDTMEDRQSEPESIPISVDGGNRVAAPPIHNETDTNSLMDETGITDLSWEEDFSCASLIAKLLCWPIMIPVLFITFFVFIFFFTVPAILLVFGLTCLYYCCTRDPIPPRVLWSAMWQDEFVMSSEGDVAGARVVYTVDQLKALCMRRTLLKRIPLNDPSCGENDDKALLVHTSHETLVFSAPLSDNDYLGTKLQEDVEDAPAIDHWPNRRQQPDESIDVERGEQSEKDNCIGKSSGHSRKLDESEGTNKQQVITTDESEWAREAACDICLLEYEPGDVVAWSHNPACSHGYHEDCVADWLVRNLSCPSCRQDFVRIEDILKARKRQMSA